MKKSFLNKLIVLLLIVVFAIIILNKFYSIANVVMDEEIIITVDEDGNAIMATKDTNDYLINPYKGFCADDNPVLKEGNILTSKINYEEYWNNRNGALATEGRAGFNWYKFYDNTFIKPDNTRNYNDSAYNWDVLKDFIIVCAKNGVDARFGVMTANTTGTDSAYGKTDEYSMSKLQEHIMPAGSIMPDGVVVENGETVYKARNAAPMWMFEGIPVSYDVTTKEYIYDTDDDVEYYLDNKELQWIPKWDDENLIKNIDDFVYSLSEYLKNEEYEGKKLIEYISSIEIKSYGNYGENHLTGINNNAKFICGDLELISGKTYTYVEPIDCYVTNEKGETYNVFESTLFNNKIRYSLNISAEYYYDNYLTTYLNAFKDTNVTIVMNWAAIWDSIYNSTDGYQPNGRLRKWIEDNEGYLTVRADSIFLNSFGDATQLYVSNGVAPSSFEYVFNTYKNKLGNDNETIKNNITNDLIKVIQNGRATYMDFSNDLYSYYVDNFDDYASEIAKFGNTLGYYFRLKQAQYNTNIVINKENNLNIDLFFTNEGVNRLYDKGDSKVYIALLETDSKGNVLYDEFNKTKVVEKYLTDINPTEWNSNFISTNEILDTSDSNNWINEKLDITIENVTIGNYMLAVGLFTNYDSESPSIKLGNTGATLDNWYTLGAIKIVLPKGDINGDGKVNIEDWNRMYNHINETSKLIGEEFERGDVNEDGKVNIKDWNRIYNHIIEENPLNILESKTAKFTITPNVTEAYFGDEITYTVKISEVSNLASIKFRLVIPEGLTFIEGKEIDGLQEKLNAAKAEFTESTRIFVVGSSEYSNQIDTTLMTFKCAVDKGAVGDKEIIVIIDEDDIFDTTDAMNNISVDYLNLDSKVKITSAVCKHLNETTVPSKTETCMVNGNNEYKICHNCERVFKTDGITETTVESETIEALGHDFSVWQSNETQHWNECSRCGTVDTKINHICADEYVNDSENHWKVCVCGKKVDKESHIESIIIKENIVPATCTKDGSYDEVRYCSVCNHEMLRINKIAKATGHTEGTPVKENEIEATVKNEGKYDLVTYCIECDEELERIKMTISKFVYEILEGAESSHKYKDNKEITIKVNGKFEKFEEIKVDGKIVNKSCYTVKEGSTIVTLKADYLDSLSIGEHEIVFVYDDGEVGTKFEVTEIKEIEEDKKEESTPKTDDLSNITFWKVGMAVSGILFVLVLGCKIKSSKRKNRGK